MYYKVFINNVEVIISNHDVADAELAPYSISVDELYDWIENRESSNNLVLVKDHFGQFWEKFCANHTLIEAAGGLVLNAEKELLVIKRLGYWDLPKGKLEEQETPKIGAIREVEEECGINDIKVIEKQPSTWHTYVLKGKKILKKTHWFLMTYNGKELLTPQAEEDITEAKFVTAKWVKKEVLTNTYASLLPLFYTYLSRYK